MDTRLDVVAKAVARGATRRQALRLAGGGLAGALLAAAGLGKRAGAQDTKPCDDLFARCVERGKETCPREDFTPDNDGPWIHCLGTEVPACRQYFQACPNSCSYMGGCGQVGCQGGQFCATAVNPAGHIVCICVEL